MIRLATVFGGIGAVEQALKRMEVPFETLFACDNGEFWIDKISRNIERDEKVDKELMFLGWKVFRFWERDIKKNPQDCINVIEEYIFEQHICILNNEEI